MAEKNDNDKLAEIRTLLASERTQLAAERTFSAWIRTGLAGVGGGLGILHFLVFNNPVHEMAANILGQLLIIWGIAIFIFAYISYFHICQRLEKSTGYKTPKTILGIFSFILLVFSILFLLISLHRSLLNF